MHVFELFDTYTLDGCKLKSENALGIGILTRHSVHYKYTCIWSCKLLIVIRFIKTSALDMMESWMEPSMLSYSFQKLNFITNALIKSDLEIEVFITLLEM